MRLLLLAAALAVAPLADARTQRDRAVPKAFQRAHPCPSTGKTSGRCPGYIRDHIIPLCKGGADHPNNLQWQTTAEAKAKDRWECRR